MTPALLTPDSSTPDFFLLRSVCSCPVGPVPIRSVCTPAVSVEAQKFFSNASYVNGIPQWGTIVVIFIETSVFARQIRELITDASCRELQQWLVASPGAGAFIQGGGGCRKVRWSASRGGKRGGIPVIYFWMTQEDGMLMLLACSKSRCDDLSKAQIRMLAAAVKKEVEGNTDG